MKKIIPVLILSFISFSSFAESYNHSGIYLGIGGQISRYENEVKTAIPAQESLFHCGHFAFGCGENLNMNDWSISPFIGIQKQFSNNIVLGIEGKYDFSSLYKQKISSQDNSTADFGIANADTGSVKIKNIGSISAKFGYALQNSNAILKDSLIYGKVGYARLKSDTDLWDYIGNSPDHHMYGNFVTHHGILFGVGMEKPLGFLNDSLKNTLIGIEYNHLNLNTKNNNAIDTSGYEGGPGVLTNPSIDSLAIKLQYKFNAL